jgi:hypothetical protein
MKKILSILSVVGVVLLAMPVYAADEVKFSASAPKTTYAVGDEIPVSFSVDAGSFSSTLQVIDMEIKVSNTALVEPTNATSPYSPGSIFTAVPIQSYTNGILHVVTHVNPESLPPTRTGVLGTATFKALAEGQVTFSYDSVKAAEAKTEMDYVSASSSSLVVNIGTSVSAATTSAGSAGSSASSATRATKAANSASTGPEDIILVVGIGALAIFLIYLINKKMKVTKI